MREILLE